MAIVSAIEVKRSLLNFRNSRASISSTARWITVDTPKPSPSFPRRVDSFHARVRLNIPFLLGENHRHPRTSALRDSGSTVIPRARKVDGLNPRCPTLGNTRRDERCCWTLLPQHQLSSRHFRSRVIKEEQKPKACNAWNWDVWALLSV